MIVILWAGLMTRGYRRRGSSPLFSNVRFLKETLIDTILLTNAKANANKYVCFCVLFWHDIVKMKEVKLKYHPRVKRGVVFYTGIALTPRGMNIPER